MRHPLLRPGFLLLESIVAVAVSSLLIVSLSEMALRAYDAGRIGREYVQAAFLASEGIDAVQAMAFRDFPQVTDGDHGLTLGSEYAFSAASDTSGIYTRVITISAGERSGETLLPGGGGTADTNTKRVVSTVTWQVNGRTRTVTLTSFVMKWW